MHPQRNPAALIGCGLAFLTGCGARTTLNPGELTSFGGAGSAGALVSSSAGAQSNGGSPAGGAFVGGAGDSGAGAGGSAAGQAGSGPCTDVGCVCLDPQLRSVTPANAHNGALSVAGVKATFTCTPHPSISRPEAMTVTGQFAGTLSSTFPMPQENSVLLMPSDPDGLRKDAYFAGEMLTARLAMPLGGPYLWQFTAAVRAKATVTFSDTGQALDPAMSTALADLDRDGDLDLVTGSSSDMLTRVYANDGVGNFTLAATLAGGREPFLADMNGDGTIDIVSDRVFLNTGGFRFADSLELGEVHAVFDADGDGDLDIFQVQGDKQWALLRNTGTAMFGTELMDQAYVFDAQTGDLDNDGDLDLVLIALVPGTPDLYRGAVLLNDGGRHFIEIDAGLEVDATRSLALGDVDGDGDLDVFMGSWGAAGARNPADQVWLNDGTARFRAGDAPLSGSPNVLLADLDGDGNLDAIAGQHSPYSTVKGEPSQVLLNDGKGHFQTSGLVTVGGSNFQHVTLGDLDGDGDLDAVVAQWDWTAKPPLQVWRQDN